MLLDWCSSPQEAQSLIEGFLKGFLKRFGYDLNKVLAEYLVGLVQETEFCWYTNDSAPWEKTAVVIIEAIDCNTTKFEMILESLRQAPAPWSEGNFTLNKFFEYVLRGIIVWPKSGKQ